MSQSSNQYRVLFNGMKTFLGFDQADIDNLVSIAPLVDKHGPAVTDWFYERMLAEPETAKHIEGKVDRLKQTHHQWLKGLVSGNYDDEYFESRWRIGLAHVRIGLAAHWVEVTMSLIRAGLVRGLSNDISDPIELGAKSTSLMKICDLDLVVINLSYAEERIERLTNFTGMKRSLLENIIKLEKR